MAMKAMTVLGEKLRKAREDKSLTIDQIQKQTRIHSVVLKALEEGRCDEMLNATYVKSYMKKYSAFLGLDSAEIAGEYAAAQASSRPPAQPQLSAPAKTEIATARGYSGAAKAVKVIVILAIALFLLKMTVTVIGSSPKKPRTAAGKKLKAAPARKAEKKRQKTGAAKKGLSNPAVIAPAAPAAPETRRSATSFDLILRVKENVLIEFKRDGVYFFKYTMQKGMVRSFTAEESIDIFVAKGQAIELVLDGKPMGSPGKGILKDVRITKKGIKVIK